MCCIALSLGAPVIDPMGNVARMMSNGVTPSAKVQETELIIWCTVEKVWMPNSSSTFTESAAATRLRSLRTKSTIITFSACSFSLVAKACFRASSSSGVWPRLTVPLMG